MSVHYKFKSALDFDTITFDGLHISVADLKKAIIHQKRLGKTMDFDLQITNAQTKEEYSDDVALIPKNTSLTIARVPLKNAPKKNWEPKVDNSAPPVPVARKGHDSAAGVQSNVDLSTMNGTEEDKIREMMYQSTADYDPTNYQKIRGASQTGEVPANYKCYRCNKPGHWIKNCPLGPIPKETMEIKRTSGIPRSFIERDKDPENNPIIQIPQVPPEEKQAIPEDLICGICKDLFTDAVMIPCCGSSFCDECVRTALLESEDNECPDCKEKGSSPGSLIPNRFLRNSVNAFRNETGYIKTQKPTNKQIKPVEEAPAPAAPVEPIAAVITTDSKNDSDIITEKQIEEAVEEDKQESDEKCDLHESYEDVSQHGDIGSPAADDKAFDNESDYEDNITVTVPPPHVQRRGAYPGHFNGRPPFYPRHETPPTNREHSAQYSGNNSNSGNRNNESTAEAGSHTPKKEEKENNYVNHQPASSKHEYGERSPEYHQSSARPPIPIPAHSHPPPHQPLPPHPNYIGQPHQPPSGPYQHGVPHPYPGVYGMQPGYPPQRPYDHHGAGMYHGERPRMMYPPRSGYPPHPPHMRPRHMVPMVPGNYPGVPNVGPGIIDDPLEAFNRIMREKERRKEQEAKQANRHRSPHADRSRRSRSFENAGNNRRGRSTERDRRRSPRQRTPDRRRTPDDKHVDERERDRDRDRSGRRRNRSSSYSSSGSRSYSRSKSRTPAKRTKSPKRRSRSPYRERRSRSRSKSFDDRRHGKHGKDRREEHRREEHRGEYRDARERASPFNPHFTGYRGRGGGYRGGPRGRGNRDGGYQSHFNRGYDRGHPQGPPGPPIQHDQYGHPMGPGPNEYHHHEPVHHHGGPGGVPLGVPPGGHYAPQQPPAQQPMPPNLAIPTRYSSRDNPRVPYMPLPVKPDAMNYYDAAPKPVPAPQPMPINTEPPPPGFEEQDSSWSGKQDAEYRAPPAVAQNQVVKQTEEDDYNNTPKTRDHDRAHTPVIRDDRHDHHVSLGRSPDKEKKKARDEGDDHHRREERRMRSKTPDRHEKEKPAKRSDHDREKEKEKKRNIIIKEKRQREKQAEEREKQVEERERGRDREREREKEREKEIKRKLRESSEEEKKDKKKEKEKKKRKKEKEAEKKKLKKERKEKEKESRSKERKKERKTVEQEEADSSQQPATPKHAPRRDAQQNLNFLIHERKQTEIGTTQVCSLNELEDTFAIPHNISKTASESEDISYREEPSSSHDQELHQSVDTRHDHSDLYSDIPEKYEGNQLEKSILEGHGGIEDEDLVNSSGMALDDTMHDEIKRSDSILDLHANLDFEADLDDGEGSPSKSTLFIGIPELSKWELDEDGPTVSSTERKQSLEEKSTGEKHDEHNTKVTTEVLKRAENAIFTRAINAIRPIEIKKISVDRQKLYSNESMLDDDDVEEIDITGDKQQDELKRFQVTVPVNLDHAERSVEIKPDVGKGDTILISPMRGSIKERLGSKITEIQSSASSTYSHSRTPPPVRKMKTTATVAAVPKSEAARKRSRSITNERDGGSRKARNERDERNREEIRISSSRRQDNRRVVVSVREPTPEKRREQDKKERGARVDSRNNEPRAARDAGGRMRERAIGQSQDRSRDKRRERTPSPERRDREKGRERERERERERVREREKDKGRRDVKETDDRQRKVESRTSRKSSERFNPHSYKDDKKSHDRKRVEGESDRRHRDNATDKDRHGDASSRKDDPRKRTADEISEKKVEIPAKKAKPEKNPKQSREAASSSDSSSSDSDSSSSDSSSDSGDETSKKRKKRKHKKDRKRAKRSASTDSDDSSSKKKRKSKKSKSGKKKKKERKHRKE